MTKTRLRFRSPLTVALFCSGGLRACGGGSDGDPDNSTATSSTSAGSGGGTTGQPANTPAPSGGAPAPAAAAPGASTVAAASPAAASPAPAPAPVSAAAPAAAPPPAPAPAPAGATAGSCGGFSQSDLLAAINAARAQARQCGSTTRPAVPALGWNSALASAASRHSTDMATRNFFSHTGSDGSDVGQRVSNAGYRWSSVGENIAAGPSTVSSVMSGWLASAGHCNNIMGANYQQVAVACVSRSGSTYTRYWTMVLARP